MEREAGEVDRLHPVGLGIDHQCADRERDAVGDAALLGVEPQQPGLAGQRIGQRPLPHLQQHDGERAAEQRGVEQVVQEMAEAEPERGGRGNLGVAAADPAHRKAAEGDHQHQRAGAEMGEDVVRPHAGCDRQHQEGRGQQDRDAVGDRHGEEVAGGGERHQGRKQQQAGDVENHGNGRAGNRFAKV